ncbi:hypothetical protein K493DRAFT_355711 [Basidiobolus meristosporus CBS 931.73]|uniref:Chitin-binding type-3 domain-containing protein n=1 Tax=Basidiobolus meristosporus CBS 931.73 TaxID=1314790 RepID=A0A1Y1Y005_9FUNG|nr:hypothetical protein K493DRAFT_355711 [Basidiobolus meristosporus CBS 931.73]|eukprot:ORX91327.1 hypothetical protein K493DRAFT_355711 [Basidiobolus meristosporus CBS 931.73]
MVYGNNEICSLLDFCSPPSPFAIILAPTVLAADDKVIVGYYVPWGNVQPSQLSFDKVTYINYCKLHWVVMADPGFGVLTEKNDPTNIFIDTDYDGPAIRELKQRAAAKGVKVQISLGDGQGAKRSRRSNYHRPERSIRLRHQGWRSILIPSSVQGLELPNAVQVVPTKPTTTSAPTATPALGTGVCDGVSAWKLTVAYNRTRKVTYNGHIWPVKWWTQNDTPGNNGQNVRTDLGAC